MNRKPSLAALVLLLTIGSGHAATESGQNFAAAEAAPAGQALRLIFKNVRPETGKIWISLCTEAEFPTLTEGGCSRRALIAAKEGAEHVFEGAPAGVYAASAFHDEDDNGQLDFDTRGIPVEATGNSRNAVGNFGPPTFDQMKFDLPPAAGAQGELVFTVYLRRVGDE